MSYLICINEQTGQILHPEIVKLCPSFQALTEKELLYVVLYTDYNSLYKQYPDHDRKRKSMLHAFGDNEYKLVESPHILTAIEDYTSLQYSPKIETAKVYQQKIDKYQEQLLEDDSAASSKKTADAIDDFTKRIQALMKEYDKEMDKQGVIKGKMQLGWLEKAMSNQTNYQSIINKNKK
jgi:hypothetical protein